MKTCPTCGQTIPPKDRRVCGRCNAPILRHHKYRFEGSMVVHRFCDDPEAYVTTPAVDQESLLEGQS